MKRTPHPKSWAEGGMRDCGPYVIDAITDETIAFIQENKSRPFFPYVAHHAPHSPFCSKEPLMRRIVEHAPEYKAAYERMKTHTSAKGRKASFDGVDFDFGGFEGADLDQELLRQTYLSMLLAPDDGVGRILDTLVKKGLRENTLNFFLSDNGAALARPNDLGGVNLGVPRPPVQHGAKVRASRSVLETLHEIAASFSPRLCLRPRQRCGGSSPECQSGPRCRCASGESLHLQAQRGEAAADGDLFPAES
jgi:arylsulfatase A-like enzyme